MLIDIMPWMETLTGRLCDALPGRIRFIGLQGSYRRGEATPQSDIDVVTVLDRVDIAALTAYRQTVSAMPHGDLACGFLCGLDELAHWPKFDLLSLALDTQPIWGELTPLLPVFSPEDIREAVRVGASVLYHAAIHTYLYHADPPAALADFAKNVFFLLRLQVYQVHGQYCLTHQELFSYLTPAESALWELAVHPAVPCKTPDALYAALIDWTSRLMA